MKMQSHMKETLAWITSLPETEMFQGVTVREAASRLHTAIEVRERLLAEQLIHKGEGGTDRYK